MFVKEGERENISIGEGMMTLLVLVFYAKKYQPSELAQCVWYLPCQLKFDPWHPINSLCISRSYSLVQSQK